MATYTSKIIKTKLTIVFLAHISALAVVQAVGIVDENTNFIYTPADIDAIVKQTCFVGINNPNIESESRNVAEPGGKHQTDAATSELLAQLTKSFTQDPVVVGLVADLHNFVWPSGRELQFSGRAEVADQADLNVVVFPRVNLDRTCLLTANFPRNPSAEVYTGGINLNFIVEFINEKCNTYRKPDGSLTMDGLHREEILGTLYHVEGGLDMKTLLQQYQNDEKACLIDSDNETDSGNIDGIDQMKDDQKLTQHSKPTNHIPFKHTDTGMQKCKRVNLSKISKSTFFHDYLKVSKPFIIEDAIHSWPAYKKWTNDYFREYYGDHKVHIKLTPYGEFEGVDYAANFENVQTFRIPDNVQSQLLFPDLVVTRPASRNMNLSQFLDVMESVSSGSRQNFSAYLEYSSIANIMPDLLEDITELPFFQGLLDLKHLNIWLSDGNTLGKLHFDPFDNFLCQISGRKQVILFEPHDNRRLYEGHIPEAMLAYDEIKQRFIKKSLVDSTSMVMSPVDITKPDLQRFPLFGSMQPLNCTIDEGDVLFMPSFWWHEVQSYPSDKHRRNLAVNFWYDPFLVREFPCQDCRLDINPNYRHLL